VGQVFQEMLGHPRARIGTDRNIAGHVLGKMAGRKILRDERPNHDPGSLILAGYSLISAQKLTLKIVASVYDDFGRTPRFTSTPPKKILPIRKISANKPP